MSFNLKYDQERIRKYHYFLLLSLIQKYKKISRSQLAKLTKMSNTTVGKIIKELIYDELVIEVGAKEGEVGRKAKLLKINEYGSYIIGVELDKNGIKIAGVTLTGEIIKKENLPFDINKTAYETLDEVAKTIETLIEHIGSPLKEKIIAVGVSIPGLVTWPEGKVLEVPQFHWEDVDIKEHLQKKLDYVVYVDNHVRTVLLAEMLFGSMRNVKNSVCIYIGSGVGGAAIFEGELIRGHTNTLGEIGHMTIDPNGALCDCGRLGCLQTFLCSSEIEKQAQLSMDEIFQRYKKREEWAVNIINKSKSYLGMAISNITCIYNPEVILLAGPMIEEYPILFSDLEEEINKYIWNPMKDSYSLNQPLIGKDSGVIGASALVLNEFLRFSNDEI